MRSIEDKGCLNNCPTEENTGGSCMIFEFKKGGGVMSRPSPHHHRSSLGKPAPSKWDDAQKWLVNLSRGEKIPAKASPRNSNADDRRLIAPAPKRDYEEEDEAGYGADPASSGGDKYVVETRNVECDDQSVWRRNEAVVRAICLRDMGTEMTPIASKEPSRAATPIRTISPASSPTSSPVAHKTSRNTGLSPTQRAAEESGRASGSTSHVSRDRQETNDVKAKPAEIKNPLEARAAAWEEAESAKYRARYKREDVRIQAWENHQKTKAELENRKVEAKVEQLKSRAEQKCKSRIAATRRVGEEKRAAAKAKLDAKAMKTSERADYIRRNGYLPSSFSFKLPSFCW